VLNAVRMTVSLLFLGAAYLWQTRRAGKGFFEPLRRHLKLILALGTLGFGVYQALFIVGIDRTTAGSAALIMGSAPLWTAVLGRFLHTEVLPAAAWVALGVTFVGTALVVVGGGEQVGGSLAGNLVMVVAAISWGAYTALSRPATKRVTPSALTFFGIAVALPLLYAIALPQWGAADWNGFGALEWAALVYSGGISSGLAIAVWTLGVKAVGASNTAIYGNLVPLVALVTGVLALGESISALQLGGGALLIAGLLWKRRLK
jgi:drug/metabolite transporter (DMT)-like permease